MRFAPVMLALLLAFSPGAVALQVSAPVTPVSPSPADASGADTVRPATGNTTAVMTLGTKPERTSFGSPALDLGSSLAMDRDEFQTELGVATLDRQLQAAKSDETKKQLLNRYRYRIENRIISLNAREREATRAFSNGTTTEREYLRQLGLIDAEAEKIEKAIGAMQAHAKTIPRFNLETEARTLEGKTVTLEGPVRHRVGQVVRGEASATKLYVSTSETGVLLSAIFGNTYVREIVRRDHRDPSATPKLTVIEARDTVLDRYSLAPTDVGGTNTRRYGSTNIFSVAVTYDHGDLVAHVDGGTEKVFKEVQHKRLVGRSSLPPGPSVTNASGNLTLAVNRTYPGGPLRVKLTNATGTPLRGQISVASEPVGRTNPNGVLWVLSPPGQFRVGATHDETTVNVTTTPINAS